MSEQPVFGQLHEVELRTVTGGFSAPGPDPGRACLAQMGGAAVPGLGISLFAPKVGIPLALIGAGGVAFTSPSCKAAMGRR
jgi:hypothetical protein